MANHASLTGADLHEPKGVAAAASGQVYVANGAASGVWKGLTFSEMPAGVVIGTAYAETSAYTSTTVTIPFDDTIPQTSEGEELLTCSYTPKVTGSTLYITVNYAGTSSSLAGTILSVFKDAEPNAIAAFIHPASYVADVLTAGSYVTKITAPSTSSIAFKLNYGVASSGSVYANGESSSRKFGGVSRVSLSVLEVKT